MNRNDDSGVTVALVALTMTALLLVVALVVDLGFVRGTARAEQSVADMAALAAGRGLASNDPLKACQDAIGYVNSNAKGMPAISASTFCTMGGNDVTSTVCSGGSLSEATPSIVSGRYTVSVHYPVPDTEIADPRFTGPGLHDQQPCNRFRVIISATDASFFGGIAGTSRLPDHPVGNVGVDQGHHPPDARPLATGPGRLHRIERQRRRRRGGRDRDGGGCRDAGQRLQRVRGQQLHGGRERRRHQGQGARRVHLRLHRALRPASGGHQLHRPRLRSRQREQRGAGPAAGALLGTGDPSASGLALQLQVVLSRLPCSPEPKGGLHGSAVPRYGPPRGLHRPAQGVAGQRGRSCAPGVPHHH